MTDKWYISGSTGQDVSMIRTYGELATVKADVRVLQTRVARLHERVEEGTKIVQDIKDHNPNKHD